MQKYLVIFEKARDNYSAYSPDLPGCIATGKTRQAVEKNIKKAIGFHLGERNVWGYYSSPKGSAPREGAQPPLK
jgi:predicted RNase H-like HicB family nuclease